MVTAAQGPDCTKRYLKYLKGNDFVFSELFLFSFSFWPHGIRVGSVSPPGAEPVTPAVEAESQPLACQEVLLKFKIYLLISTRKAWLVLDRIA